MKRKRHYFCLPLSVMHTLIVVFNIALWSFLVAITALNNNIIGLVVSSSLLVTSIIVGCLMTYYNGWASWEVIDGNIIVKKLFRKKRSIKLDNVDSIVPKRLESISFDGIDSLDGYAISGDGVTIVLPKTKASDALVEEIKKRNNI